MSFNTPVPKDELQTIMNRIHSLPYPIHTVFLISPEERFKALRHTYENKEKLELLIILENPVLANLFYNSWVSEMKQVAKRGTTSIDIQVVTIDEFVREIETLESYRERLLKGRILYDRELSSGRSPYTVS